MSSVTLRTSLRQASRFAVRNAGQIGRFNAPRIVSPAISREAKRTYVSETKKDSAQVDVSSTIKADQQTFFEETGRRPENVSMPGVSANADAMMDPMAGELS